MGKRTAILAVAVAGILSLRSDATPATCTVTTSARMDQSIDGLGGFGSMKPTWFTGPYYNQKFLDLLIDSLGLTILRIELPPQPEQTGDFTKFVPYYQAIMAKAQTSHEPLKVIGSVWTPPKRMKDGGSDVGGKPLPDSLDAYGKYLVGYAKQFDSLMGYNLHAISPQNEPALCTGYNSACYYPDEFAPVVIAAAHQFKNANLPVWLHYADNVAWGYSDQLGAVIAKVCQDPVADSIGHIMSGHYGQGLEVTTGSHPDANDANYYYWFHRQALGIDTCASWPCERHYNKGKKSRMWNTEWGGYFNEWNDNIVDETGDKPGGAWMCARSFFFALSSGFNAVVYWALSDVIEGRTPNSNHYSMMYLVNGVPTPGPLFYTLKCFYRYIRPGAVRVNCASSDSANVKALAFVHDSLHTVTVVMLNYAATQQSVTVNGTGLPVSMNAYQTSPTQNCASIGSVAPGGTVMLPPMSITTLCNTANTAIASPDAAKTHVRRETGEMERRFSIDGRQWTNGDSEMAKRMHAAVLLVVRRNGRAYVQSLQ